MNPAVVVAAGGTGGHLVPALAVAAAVRRMRPDASISFVGTRRGLERELVPAAGYRVHMTSVVPLTRGMRGLLAPPSMLPATIQARRILRAERASVVLGMGGYPSLPVVAAARLGRIPAVIHEQNAVPGLANQAAARLTPHVAVSFPEAVGAFGGRRPRLVGVPLRAEIASLDRRALRPEALSAFGLEAERRTALVFGGSIGAARLNEAAVGLAERWRDRDDVQLLLATGRAHHDAVAARLPVGKLVWRCVPFIDRMDLAYAAADVVVARAGGSTVAELAVAELPSVLVPLPYARRHEQDANARALVVPGAAVVLRDVEATGERLAGLLEEILGDEERLARMGAAARGAGRPGAAEEMAAWVIELAESGRG